jgi:hypothetical protein
MKDYIKAEVVEYRELDSYLQKGWEIFETTKTVFDNGESTLHYHIGLQARTKINNLKHIIQLYEEHGLKEELFKMIAEINGDNIEDYDQSPDGHRVKNEMVSFLEQYEAAVNDKQTKFFKKLSSEEIAERYGL